jgi:N-acetylglucosamine kinase-like BadF-type ATPase
MRYFLGMDVGATKTHALIADETGACLGFGRAGGGNYQGVGYDGLAEVLQKCFERASQMAGVPVAQIAGAGFGIAGYDFPSDRAQHLQAIATLGLACPVDVVNDAVNGLMAGTSHGYGVNVSAGSSNNCRGRGRDGREARIVGNGQAFGEYGGAIEITARALKMVNYAWIKRGPQTALTQVFLNATDAKDEMDLMEGLSKERYHLFPFIAVDVFRVAVEGDEVAKSVIRWAGEELGWLAVAAIRQLGLENDEVEVVQSGSVYEGGALLTGPMCEIVLRHAPKAKLIRLDAPPVVGAILLGMELAGFDGYTVRARLLRSANEIVK